MAGSANRDALERLVDDPIATAMAPALRALLAGTLGQPGVEDLGRILSPPAGVRFAPQAAARGRRGAKVIDLASRYDGTIATRGVVPTREGSLHDILNALVWASLPTTKRAIHTRQFAVMKAHVPGDATRMPNARPREADVLAMLDEGGLVFVVGSAEARAALERTLQTGDVEKIAVAVGSLEAEVLILGHAVLEHVAEERDGDPRAAAYVVVVGSAGALDAAVPRADAASARLGAVDRALATCVSDAGQMTGPPPWPAVPVRALQTAMAVMPRSGEPGHVSREGQNDPLSPRESTPDAPRRGA